MYVSCIWKMSEALRDYFYWHIARLCARIQSDIDIQICLCFSCHDDLLIQLYVASVKPYVKGALSAKSETCTYVQNKSADVPSCAQKYAMLSFFLTINTKKQTDKPIDMNDWQPRRCFEFSDVNWPAGSHAPFAFCNSAWRVFWVHWREIKSAYVRLG